MTDPVQSQPTSLVPLSPPPPPPTAESFRDGLRTGRRVASFEGGNLVAGQRADADFGSFEAAAAYARGLGGSSVIVAEQGRYVIYRTSEADNGAWLLWSGSQFDRNAATVDGTQLSSSARGSDPGVVALVTDDRFLVDLTTGRVEVAGPSTGPYAGRIEAFGPSLASLSERGQFEREFELALRDTALYSLDQAQTLAEQTRARLGGTGFDSADRAAIDRVVPRLQAIDQRIANVRARIGDAQWQLVGANLGNPASYVPLLNTVGLFQSDAQRAAAAEIQRLQQELQQLEQQRIAAAQEFPLLLRVDLVRFSAMSEAEQVATLRSEADGVLRDISTTRDNVLGGSFNLWTNGALLNTTAAGLGLSPERLQWVQDRATSEGRWQAVTSIGTAVIGIGLAVGGAALAPFSAGTSTAGTVVGVGMIATSLGIGVYDAVTTTQGYLRDQAAANSALDPNAGLLAREDAGHWGWVALSWVGVGIDAAQAVGAVAKLARAGSTVDDLLGATPQGLRALQQAADELGVAPQVLADALRATNNGQLATQVMASADFTRSFGSRAGDAVTLINRNADGSYRFEVVFRDGLSPSERVAALSEETVHLRQLTQDPALAARAEVLSESNLARWGEMAPSERLQAYSANLTLEADAQRRLIDAGGSAPQQLERAQERLALIERQLREVDDAIAGRAPVPAWIADAPPPRLFSAPAYPQTNAAAVAAGYPSPPDGHYYRELGNGQYQLTRFQPGQHGWVDPEVSPPMRLVTNSDGSRVLVPRDDVPLSAAQRRAEIEAQWGQPLLSPEGRAIEAALDAAGIQSPFARAYTRQFADALTELDRLGGDSGAVIARLAGASDAQAGEVLRQALRADTVAAIRALPESEQLAALQRVADAWPPANRLRGELFTAYRESVMPAGFARVEPPTNGLHVSSSGRPADGLLEVSNNAIGAGPLGPQHAGRYLVEDKFGSSFNLDQARAYSNAFDTGSGLIRTQDGASHQGIVYVFSNAASAQRAVAQLDEAGLNGRIHVAILTGPGSLQWLR